MHNLAFLTLDLGWQSGSSVDDRAKTIDISSFAHHILSPLLYPHDFEGQMSIPLEFKDDIHDARRTTFQILLVR